MKRCLPLLFAATLLLLSTPAHGEEGPITRAAFLSLIWQSAGGMPWDASEPFPDVPQDSPYMTALCWARDHGITLGTGAGHFCPDRPITREEAALFLRRYGGYYGRDTSAPLGLSQCNDGLDSSPWAGDALYWAVSCNLISWSPGGRLEPCGFLTTTQASQSLLRFMHGFGSP